MYDYLKNSLQFKDFDQFPLTEINQNFGFNPISCYFLI